MKYEYLADHRLFQRPGKRDRPGSTEKRREGGGDRPEHTGFAGI